MVIQRGAHFCSIVPIIYHRFISPFVPILADIMQSSVTPVPHVFPWVIYVCISQFTQVRDHFPNCGILNVILKYHCTETLKVFGQSKFIERFQRPKPPLRVGLEKMSRHMIIYLAI